MVRIPPLFIVIELHAAVAEITGFLTVLGITACLPEVGTPLFQFEAVCQSVELLPVHVVVTGDTSAKDSAP